nr:hypothetical protein [Tanacetum cinerariifolium]
MTVDIVVIPIVIPAIISEIAPEAMATDVASHAGMLDLAIHPDSKTKPYEAPSSANHAPVVPMHAFVLPVDHPVVAPSPPVQATLTSSADLVATVLSTPYSESSSSSFGSSPISSDSSSGTSHTSLRPLPRRRHQLSSYSIPSPSVLVGPSCKRCRSPTTSLLAAVSTPAILSHVAANCLPPRKRFRGLPTASPEDDTSEASIEDAIELIAEVAAKPVILSVHLEQTIKERLKEYEETIQEMYDHLLEIPLSKIDWIKEDV